MTKNRIGGRLSLTLLATTMLTTVAAVSMVEASRAAGAERYRR
jgi:hypothetical protein